MPSKEMPSKEKAYNKSLSKWTAWDYIKQCPQIITPTASSGLNGFFIADSYLERFFLDRLKSHLGNAQKRILLGNEITIGWLENNLLGLDLFGSNEHIIVLHADEISSNVLEYWEKNAPTLEDRHVIFFFRKAGKNSQFDQWAKKSEGEFVKIEEATFWQGKDLLNFLSDEMHVPVSFEVRDYLLTHLDHETTHFVSALEIIRNSFEDSSKVQKKEIEEFIVPKRFDKFKMASLMASKDYKIFWSKTYTLEDDQIRELFNFLQSHLLKVAFPDLLVGKARDSKYGKEILAQSKFWKSQEITAVIRACAEIEVDAKNVKNSFLRERLRRAYLRIMK